MNWKRLTSTMAGMAAFAALLVLPSAASASPQLTYPTGTLLGTGNTIRMHNVGTVSILTTEGAKATECSSGQITGTLRKNSGTAIEADIESFTTSGTGAGGECTGALSTSYTMNFSPATNGLPWCLRATSAMAADEYQIRGNKCSSEPRPIRYSINLKGIGECVYERTTSLSGTLATHPEDALLTLAKMEFKKVSGSLLCPSATVWEMIFTMERDVVGTNPVYVS
jgi:hypothetical protein